LRLKIYSMKITKDKVVSLTYDLRLDHENGEVVETLDQEGPLVFLYGSGNLLPKFEENINGLIVGDSFKFNLTASEAYGEKDSDAVVSVPVSVFEVDGQIDRQMVQIGKKIPMQDSSGNKLTGTIIEIKADSVLMDFNHPLAGNKLYFEGKIVDVREATDEELSHGHAINAGTCDHCEDCGDHGHC
jgi:FKBP-type peptidyl-prolyl cis-trans isomerase SlyD